MAKAGDSSVSQPLREMNNHKQGRSGSGTPKKMGPAVGNVRTNPTRGGGINRAAQSGNAPRSGGFKAGR